MKTIWKVIITILDDDEQSPLINFNGGWDKTYAVCSNKGNAEEIKSEIDRIGTTGLRRLKIIKHNQSLTECFVSIPHAVDNHEAILKKLRSV